MSFVHLHCHTDYSFGDSTARIEDYIESARKAGMKILAISDSNSIAGAIRFAESCIDADIKPIIAAELSTCLGNIICIAMNNRGLNSLSRLINLSSSLITAKDLKNNNEGLICLSGYLAGKLTQKILADDIAEAKSIALWFKEVFADRFYLEMQDHGKDEDRKVLPSIKAISEELGIETVCTNDIHYIKSEDADAYNTLCCIRNGSMKDLPLESGEYYFKSPEQMEELFSWCPEAVENTSRIADRCNIDFASYLQMEQEYPYTDDHESADLLVKLVNQGIENRYPVVTDTIRQRIDAELNVIIERGYSDYFLIIHYLVIWARKKGIVFSPGLGHSVSSIVCYILEITDIDPIEYGLVFERFIKQDTQLGITTILEVDEDGFPMILRYLNIKYGNQNLAYTNRFYTKHDISSAARLIAPAYGNPDLSWLTNETMDMLEKKIKMQNCFSDNKIQHADSFVSSVRKITGLINGYKLDSYPAMTICRLKDRYLPLHDNPDFDLSIIQYDWFLNLPAFEIRPARNQQIIRHAEKIIRFMHDSDFDIRKINMSDAKTFALINSGDDSHGWGIFTPFIDIIPSAEEFYIFDDCEFFLKEELMKLKPQSIRDLAVSALLASNLSPISVEEYLKKEEIADQEKAKILEETNGHMLYTEQFIQAIQLIHGVTLPFSESLVRGFNKKKFSELKALLDRFKTMAKNNGMDPDTAEKIFYTYLYKSDKYTHSKEVFIPCAMVAYQLGFIKANYPDVFQTALSKFCDK